jgi:hypothetical protein
MLPATVTVIEVPALTTKGSPTIAWWLELSVLAIPICVPSLFRSTTPANTASCARPDLSTVIELTVTSADPAVRTTVVNGTLAALCGANEFAGCEPAETESAPPVGVVVPPVEPVEPEFIEFNLARVIAPT